MIPGAVHRSPGICLKAEENLGKPQLRERMMRVRAASHRLKWGPLLQNEVSRIVRKEEGNKGGKDGYNCSRK